MTFLMLLLMQPTYDRRNEGMGRVSESTTENRFGLYGEPEVFGEDGASDQGRCLLARLCYSSGKRRDCQRDDSLHDVAASSG